MLERLPHPIKCKNDSIVKINNKLNGWCAMNGIPVFYILGNWFCDYFPCITGIFFMCIIANDCNPDMVKTSLMLNLSFSRSAGVQPSASLWHTCTTSSPCKMWNILPGRIVDQIFLLSFIHPFGTSSPPDGLILLFFGPTCWTRPWLWPVNLCGGLFHFFCVAWYVCHSYSCGWFFLWNVQVSTNVQQIRNDIIGCKSDFPFLRIVAFYFLLMHLA